ncbi:MAG: type 1 glutamine amidotransferase [Candidatus Omnitrophica bacterium]|nr:type 1 glutamine amidotransferase [Candidatus Omnitrophota bacterium]
MSRIDAVIILGGPMNVYEEDSFPFLKAEDVFIKKAIRNQIPLLGICLGSQLIAKACGAEVRRAKEQEIGWYKASLTGHGMVDPLFDALPREFDVFQWHQDTFDIPDKGQLIAFSASCRNQAFSFGENAYGLQFHIEVDDSMIEDWTKKYFENDDPFLELSGKSMLLNYYKIEREFNDRADRIFLNFAKMIKASEAKRSGRCHFTANQQV